MVLLSSARQYDLFCAWWTMTIEPMCYVSTNVCLTQAGLVLLSLGTARTSANLMRKVATIANMARETASMKR